VLAAIRTDRYCPAVVALARVFGLVAVAGCVSEPSWFNDGYFTHWDDQRVMCSMGADSHHSWPRHDLAHAIDRAAREGSVLHTFAHAPWVHLDDYAPLFTRARNKGVEFVTYAQLIDRTHPRAGWAFSIDDWQVDTWYGWRDQLRAWGVTMTFFVADWDSLTSTQIDELHALAAEGHDIEPHGMHHIAAAPFARKYDAETYVATDVVPELAVLDDAGFVPTAFAYPFGSHTPDTDAAVLESLPIVRTASFEACGHRR
jgi:hypothetical protein